MIMTSLKFEKYIRINIHINRQKFIIGNRSQKM